MGYLYIREVMLEGYLFQFPLWDTIGAAITTSSIIYGLSIPFMGYNTKVFNIKWQEFNFQFPLWDTVKYLFALTNLLKELSIPFMGYI